MKIRTRFAPSPTGFLHVGGIRTALFNFLYAKRHGGVFILRLEDTDRERFVAEGVQQIVEGLDWIGLCPNEGFWIADGKHTNINYVQSERHRAGYYQRYADRLLDEGLAYYSYITPDEYERNKQECINKKTHFIYRKELECKYHNRVKPSGDYPIRLDIQAVLERYQDLADNGLAWHDEIRGDFVEDLRNMEDFVLIKSDGFPTYNFANVIDDHEMQISHVIRGDEFIASTAKHELLYRILGYTPPHFVHLPVINGSDGKKLSKRTGDTNVLDYRDKGYLPEALINFLALLGWNDGSEQEIFSLDDLALKFSLERINNSPAVFDQKRLDWMNGHYIRQLSLDELYERVSSYWPEEAKAYSSDYKKQVLGLIQERLKYLGELAELTRFFFVDLPISPSLISDHKQLKKLPKNKLCQLLQVSYSNLEESSFDIDDLTTRLNGLLESTAEKPAVLFSLIRIATTRAPVSPGLSETLAVLGKETSLRRLSAQIDSLRH